ncbi:MAG TPA: M56 family metallopeptidase [Candidatus Blautia intestinavium]|nr:M56 family metallopeptidase [Candidatus Blautia intestinavium]
MLFSSSILILITVLLRIIFGKYLPGRLFVALWTVAMLRLMLPVALPVPVKTGLPFEISRKNITFVQDTYKNTRLLTLGIGIWVVGTVIFWSILLVKYYRSYILLAQSLPCEEKDSVLLKKLTKRNIQICISDRIIAPVTYGILKSRIVLPKNIACNNSELIKHVIIHEGIHIIRMDNLLKFAAFLMLGFYWFDPFMWLLCYFLSKDIEIACDQKVLAYIGISGKKRYASSLYQMAETYSENFLLFSGFGKNPAIERIDKIMKYKKRKIILPLSVLIIVMAAFGVFAADKSLFTDGTENVGLSDKESSEQSSEQNNVTEQKAESSGTKSQDDPVTEENSRYNLNRKYREWYPEMTDEEALAIEKLHEYNRNFIRELTGEIVEPPEN